MLAFGVVFVLLIGEIDLSISYVAGIGAVAVAELQLPGSGHQISGLLAIPAAIAICAVIGLGQGSIIARVGVPSFVVTLAGFLIWQGVILQDSRRNRARSSSRTAGSTTRPPTASAAWQAG